MEYNEKKNLFFDDARQSNYIIPEPVANILAQLMKEREIMMKMATLWVFFI